MRLAPRWAPSRALAGVVTAAALASLALPACSAHPSAGASPTGSSASDVANPSLDLPQGTVTVARAGSPELTLHAQIAETDHARATGLMGVKKMSDQAGMAFLFGGPTTESFWMKDTLIPLDIAFISHGVISEIDSMVPCRVPNCPLTTPAQAYDMALEVNPGYFHTQRLGVGARAAVAGGLPEAS